MKPGVYVETEEEIIFIATLDEVLQDETDDSLHQVVVEIRDRVVDAMTSFDDDERVITIRIVQ